VKIISVEEAARLGGTLASGYFDPLLASHTTRLAELKRDGVPLIVLIATSKDSILPAQARAELVAGLRVVDYVVASVEGLTPHVRLEPEDVMRREKLIEHVHARQQAAS
jgi:hypothetical protein